MESENVLKEMKRALKEVKRENALKEVDADQMEREKLPQLCAKVPAPGSFC